MRKIRIIEHISLDGVIQSPGARDEDGDYAHGGWAMPYSDEATREAVATAQGKSFDLLLGRRTYDIFTRYWPKVVNDPVADSLNAATKYVATHRPDSLQWGPFEHLGADTMDAVRGVKSKNGPDLIVWGSTTLTRELLEQGLAMRFCCSFTRSCWARANGSFRTVLTRANSLSSAPRPRPQVRL